MSANTAGEDNVSIGCRSMDANTSGNCNTFVGKDAGLSNTVGFRNSGFGIKAGENVTTGDQNVFLGFESGAQGGMINITTQDNRLVAGHSNITDSYVKVDWTVTSDLRDKTNFGTVPHGLDFVNQLQPVSFQFRTARGEDTTNGGVRYGFKAQDILALEKANGGSNVIIDDEFEECLKLTGGTLLPVLVNAIKELKTENDSLKTRIENLEG